MTFNYVDVFENKSIQNLVLLGKFQKIVCFRSTSGQIFLCGISTVLWVCKCFVNRKCLCCQYWFLIKTFYTVSKKKLSNCGPRNRCFQILTQKRKFCDLLKMDFFAVLSNSNWKDEVLRLSKNGPLCRHVPGILSRF